MQPAKQFIVLLIVILFLGGCKSSPDDTTLHVYVGNLSRINKQVDVQVSVSGQSLFDSAVNLAPSDPYGYTSDQKLSKGNYVINVTADSGKIKLMQPVTVNGELWVFISYTFGAATGTIFQPATLKNRPSLASIDMTKSNPSLHIFISDSKPASLQPDSSFRKWAEDTSGIQ
jgi:hypothetical protein